MSEKVNENGQTEWMKKFGVSDDNVTQHRIKREKEEEDAARTNEGNTWAKRHGIERGINENGMPIGRGGTRV